ncbi:MAG: hypothetical protein ACP5I1_21575, partial [Candidatus Hinthialibacter sp.]
EEVMPPAAEQNASIKKPAIHEEEIPTLQIQGDSKTIGSKTRSIRSVNAEPPAVNLYEGKIIDSLHSADQEGHSSLPAAPSVPEPEINAPAGAPSQENPSGVEPVTQAEIAPVEIQEIQKPEKTVDESLPGKGDNAAPLHNPNVVSQAGYIKPGLVPAGAQDPTRLVIASDRLKHSAAQTPEKNFDNKGVKTDQDAGAVLASRFLP